MPLEFRTGDRVKAAAELHAPELKREQQHGTVIRSTSRVCRSYEDHEQMHRDAKCVYVANSPGEADVVAVWLEEQGFPSRVMNMSTLGGLAGLTPFSPLAIGA